MLKRSARAFSTRAVFYPNSGFGQQPVWTLLQLQKDVRWTGSRNSGRVWGSTKNRSTSFAAACVGAGGTRFAGSRRKPDAASRSLRSGKWALKMKPLTKTFIERKSELSSLRSQWECWNSRLRHSSQRLRRLNRNTGKMGWGKCSSVFYWSHSERVWETSNKWDIILSKANLPLFHRSIIPQARQKLRP